MSAGGRNTWLAFAALVAIATPVSFGSTILRAETAAIYGLSVLKGAIDVSAR